MSGPYVEQTGEVWAATALGEQEPVGESGLTASEEMVLQHLQPHVAALVAAAEERGAAKERERLEPLLRSAANTCARSPLCVPAEYAAGAS